MDEIFAALSETYRIYAPVKRGKFIRYGEVKSVEQVVWNEKSHFSPKEVFYPIVQTLLYFSENDVRESEVDDKPAIILLRPCDINGITASTPSLWRTAVTPTTTISASARR